MLSIGINIAAGFLIRSSFKKIKKYESLVIESDTWIATTKDRVMESLDLMRTIDKQGVFSSSISEKGIFESDDLVGQIFKQLMGILEDLNTKINE